MKNVQGKKSNIGDQIPVDYVVDFILVAAAYTANDKSFHVKRKKKYLKLCLFDFLKKKRETN